METKKQNQKQKMKTYKHLLLGLMLLALAGTAQAHFTMVLPASTMDVTPEDFIADVGETKDLLIVWGHPYEHILFDMTSTPTATVTSPDGETQTLTLQTYQQPWAGKTFKAYTTKFTVTTEGDWLVSVRYEDEGEQLIDNVKTVIHCGEEAWVGWDRALNSPAEIVPYVRPYGMEAGFAFSGQALANGKPLAKAPIEIEVYHREANADHIVEMAEEKFPYDAPMVFTRLMNSNEAGDFTYTLDEAGIWYVGVTHEIKGQLAERGVFQLAVIDAFPPENKQHLGAPTGGDVDAKLAALKAEISEAKTAATATTPQSSGSTLVWVAIVLGIVALIVAFVKR